MSKTKETQEAQKERLFPEYLEKAFPPETIDKKVIYQSAEGQYAIVTPAAYTKDDRQKNYEALWNLAVSTGTENERFPFGYNHSVLLVKEPTNQYDKHAVRLKLSSQYKSHPLNTLDGIDLGYIPSEISLSVTTAIDNRKINAVRILGLSNKMFGKWYGGAIILGYGRNYITEPGTQSFGRFSRIRV